MLLPGAEGRNPQPSSPQPSSPRPSSSSSQPGAPSYLSARSADVILSEVRPTRIKSEALRSVNVLLDEILWLILGYARSFATDRLRTGLLKVLPTSLGKDALLEAEVELRAYIERNPPATPVNTDESSIQKFPLQPAFELLRIKCEAYSSLGDQEENPETETALHERMVQITGDATPKASAVAPAALYLTAILEHICEHVLTNVGRVVARDSSRTTAHAQDLYVALCEDESIYSLFKTMKVQEQIEQQSKMTRPRRSKSFSRNDLVTEKPLPGPSSDAPALPKPRQSLDSVTPNGSNPNLANRSSVDKGRNKGLFKNSSSRTLVADSGQSNSGDAPARHRRSNSLLGDKKLILPDEGSTAEAPADLSPGDDDGSMQDFDDLMRSGTTMKVSLTPDRLKTFEVFAKEKNQRANRPGQLPPSPSGRDASAPPSSFPNGAAHYLHKANQSSRTRNHVESIAESPEGEPIRSRAASITSPAVPKEEKPPRSRSFTDTRASTGRSDFSSSLSSTKPSESSDDLSSKHIMPVAVIDPATGLPKRTRRAPVRNRESIDLDDVMDGSEEEVTPAKKVSLTPKSAQTGVSGARDLMDFLSEGPPEPQVVAPVSPGPSVVESQRSKQGRFRTIVSRLTGSSSIERLSSRPGEESTDGLHRSSTMGINGNSAPQRVQPATLHSKRSAPNVAAMGRPMVPSLPSPLSPPSHENHISPPGLRPRQPSLTRKAVPAWEGNGSREKAEPSLPAKSSGRQSETTGSPKPPPKLSVSQAAPGPTESVGAVPSLRKRPVRESEQNKDTSNGSVTDRKTPSPSPVSPHPGTHSTNGHAKPEQEPTKGAPRGSSRGDRRAAPPGLTLAIPAEEHILNLRRLMARATNADECRVLMDMFLAKCGAPPGDAREQASGPITPPVSPIRAEIDNHHEYNLIEVLLGDGAASPVLPPPVVSDAVSTPSSLSTNHTHPRSFEPTQRRSPQPRASPILTPAPSPIVATTS